MIPMTTPEEQTPKVIVPADILEVVDEFLEAGKTRENYTATEVTNQNLDIRALLVALMDCWEFPPPLPKTVETKMPKDVQHQD